MAKAKALTAKELQRLCETRWPLPEWVCLSEARNMTGYGAQERYADVLAMSCYPSRGLQLIGCELKSSRSDAVRELLDPCKAMGIQRYCDRWYLVVGKSDLVDEDEVPAKWGLLVPSRGGKSLRVARQATKLEAEAWPRTFVASLLRNAYRSNPGIDALRAEHERGRAAGAEQSKRRLQSMERKIEGLDSAIRSFQRASGISLSQWTGSEQAAREGAAFRLSREIGLDAIVSRAAALATTLELQAARVRKELEAVDCGTMP